MNPLLTIAIPTYERAKYLAELLQSIDLPKDLEGLVEVVVSDNASSYDVRSIIPTMGLSFPVRIHVNETNIGATQNFINCVAMSAGRFVWLVGDDELLIPGSLVKTIKVLKDNPDVGLVFLSAKNWDSSPPFQKRYPSFSEALQELSQVDERIPLKQTLISVAIFRRVDFDFQLAYRKFFSNYGQAFGMVNLAGRRPVVVLSSADPIVLVREVRVESADLPPKLVRTQVRYLKYLSRRFGARSQRRYARHFLWGNRINAVRDWIFRSWKRVSPQSYEFAKTKFSKKS